MRQEGNLLHHFGNLLSGFGLIAGFQTGGLGEAVRGQHQKRYARNPRHSKHRHSHDHAGIAHLPIAGLDWPGCLRHTTGSRVIFSCIQELPRLQPSLHKRAGCIVGQCGRCPLFKFFTITTLQEHAQRLRGPLRWIEHNRDTLTDWRNGNFSDTSLGGDQSL